MGDREYMRNDYGGGGSGGLNLRLPQTPLGWIILINIAVFLAQQWGGVAVIQTSEGVTPGLGTSWEDLKAGKIWTLITHQFAHYNLLHLGGNMILTFIAGRAVQSVIGGNGMLIVYLIGGMVGALLQIAVKYSFGIDPYLCGASGSAFALLAAFAVLMPREELFLMLYFVIPLRLKVMTLAMILIGADIVLGLLDLGGFSVGNIAHFAHIGGALFGYLYLRRLGYGGPLMTLDRLRGERAKREGGGGRQPRAGKFSTTGPERSEAKQKRRPKDFVSSEIDPILDKINEQGFQSLTEEERAILDRGQDEIQGQSSD